MRGVVGRGEEGLEVGESGFFGPGAWACEKQDFSRRAVVASEAFEVDGGPIALED